MKNWEKRINKRPTNLTLRNSDAGQKIAEERYGISLSEMVDRLLAREIGRKNGLLGKKMLEATA